MTATYYKRTSMTDALPIIDEITPIAIKVTATQLGSGSIVQIDASINNENEMRKLNEIFYKNGWVNDLKSLSCK